MESVSEGLLANDQEDQKCIQKDSYMFNILKQTLQNNIDYFACTCQDDFTQNFVGLLEAVTELEKMSCEINSVAPIYDAAVNTPANGYRSYCIIVDRFITNTLDICRQIVEKRDSMFFRAGKFVKDVEVRYTACKELRKAGAILLRMIKHAEPGELFVRGKMDFKGLMKDYYSFDIKPFHGRLLGFTMCESLQNCLSACSIAMATFSEQFKNDSSYVATLAASLFNSTSYGVDIDKRSERNAQLVRSASVDFVKSFWTLNELPITKKIPGWICPSLEVCERVVLPLEPLKMKRKGEALDIPYPSSHLSTQPVRGRLFSHVRRQGQDALIGVAPTSVYEYPPTSTFFLHLHGGGFISQSPDSHEIYLRQWAADIEMPLLSVDYSLAPQAPFPRALEELFYAYAWIVNNPFAVGWSGEKIVVGGDSGGGNLSVALALKCLHLGVRPPDGLFAAYAPLCLQLTPSPSKLLCAVDSLIPLEFLLHCLYSYCGVGIEERPHLETSAKHSLTDLESKIAKGAINQESELKNHGGLSGRESVAFEGASTSTLQDISEAVYDTTAKLYQSHIARPLEMFTGTNQAWQSDRPWFSPNPLDATRIDQTFARVDALAASPFISPLLADDHLLSRLPPTFLLGLHLDPTIDDMVTFTRKLHKLGRPCELVVLDRLPHGFLNFLPFSSEAAEGSKVCCDMLRDAFAFVPANPINPLEDVPL